VNDIAQFTQQAVADDRCSKAFALEVEERLLAMQAELDANRNIIVNLVRDIPAVSNAWADFIRSTFEEHV
jgi:hypothetical protein